MPDQAIVLVPDPDVGGRHRPAVEFAAESWNLEFGTQFSVADRAPDGQSVAISWYEDECATDDGFIFAGFVDLRGDHIELCPQYTRDRYVDFFETMRHELGHVLGLEHGRDLTAVMGASEDRRSPGALQRRFRPEDRREFARVNPTFSGLGGCSINHVFAEDALEAAMVTSGEAPYVVWSGERSIAYAAVDPATGERNSEAAMIASMTSTIAALSVHPSAEGFMVSWSEVSGIYRAFVTPGGEARAPQRLSIPWHKPSEHISSNIYADRTHYLAISAYAAGTTRLIEVGADGEILTSTTVADRGSLIFSGGELFFAASIPAGPGRRSARVTRFGGDRFAVREQLDLAETFEVDPETEPYVEPISGFAVHGELWVFADRPESTAITRVSTAGALAVIDRVELGERLQRANILEVGSELLIAAWRRPEELYQRELYFAFFDRNLTRNSAWARISGVDQIPGGPPALYLSEDILLLGWSEGGEARTRCTRVQ